MKIQIYLLIILMPIYIALNLSSYSFINYALSQKSDMAVLIGVCSIGIMLVANIIIVKFTIKQFKPKQVK